MNTFVFRYIMTKYCISIILFASMYLKAECSSYANEGECSGRNEVWTECDNNSCQRNCETFHMKNLACKPICTPGCICKKGYLRNKKGVCVRPKKCDNPVCPELNEEYSLCVSPCAENCAILGRFINCNFLVCNAGCDCKPNFMRNLNGTCVLPSQCDCPENEHLVLCNNPCPPEGCDDIDKMFKCAAVDPKTCKPACKCNSQYKRNEDGVCIPINKCPKYPLIKDIIP